MSNRLKNDFTSEMIKRSKVVLQNETGFEDRFKELMDNPDFVNLTPDEKSLKIMGFFQEDNTLRPEILLDRSTELSKIAFKDETSFNEFQEELSLYQYNEQLLIANRRNGSEIKESFLNESLVMPFKDQNYALVENDKNIELTDKLLDLANQNIQIKGIENELFVDTESFIKNISKEELDLIEEPVFEPLLFQSPFKAVKDNPNGLIIGKDIFNLSQEIENLDRFNPTPENMEELENERKNDLKMKQRIKDEIRDRFNEYNREGKHFTKDGEKMFSFKKNLITRSIEAAYGGNKPSKDTIIE